MICKERTQGFLLQKQCTQESVGECCYCSKPICSQHSFPVVAPGSTTTTTSIACPECQQKRDPQAFTAAQQGQQGQWNRGGYRDPYYDPYYTYPYYGSYHPYGWGNNRYYDNNDRAAFNKADSGTTGNGAVES
ncbi:MAG: hypothetical protein WCJ56_15150 [bacterium]